MESKINTGCFQIKRGVKLSVRIPLFGLLLLLFSCASSQEYTDLFPDTRAPYRFRIYEKEVLKEKKIDRIDIIWVDKYLNTHWRRGLLPFTGDTTKLVFQGWCVDRDFPEGSELRKIKFPTYTYKDTVYVMPTHEGFLEWKIEHGYK